MKPEYNYGLVKERYSLRLLSNDAGENLQALQKLLAQRVTKYDEYSFDIFKKLCQRPFYQMLNIYFQNYDECIEFTSKLRELGAKPEIDDLSVYRVVNPDVLVKHAWEQAKQFAPVMKRLNPDYEWDDSYEPDENKLLIASMSLSGNIVALKEYALDIWAQANGIDFAYRVTIEVSQSSEIHCIRIWRQNDEIHAVTKHYPRMFGEKYMQMIKTNPSLKFLSSEVTPTIQQWDRLEEKLRDKFWKYDTWRVVVPGGYMLDGIEYSCEGWRDGQYKILSDRSGEGSVAHEVYQQFREIIEE